MKQHYHPEPLPYTGDALSNHWIYKRYGVLGDGVVAFAGPCQVNLDSMVDLEDVRNEDDIYSTHMLHFIVEVFGVDLKEGVLLQRLFTSIVCDKLIQQLGPEWAGRLRRSGDDLFLDGSKKLSVSICTLSPTSILIHMGLNIESDGTPVETAGLRSELGIEDVEAFATACMRNLCDEWKDILRSTCKVRAVT